MGILSYSYHVCSHFLGLGTLSMKDQFNLNTVHIS